MLQALARSTAIGEELIQKQHLIDLELLEHSVLAAEFASTSQWDDEGFNTPIDWLRIKCGLTEKQAADRLVVGRQAPNLKQSVDALRAGLINFAHLVVIARTADAVGKVFDEYGFICLATEMSPGRLYYEAQHYRHRMDARQYAWEQNGLMENRRLSLTTAEDGCLLVNGVLDPVGGAAVRTVLEPLARRSGSDDDRDVEQRNADALVELAIGKQQKVAMQVTASVETLLGLVGARGAENEFSLPISSATVARWACDCSLTRVLMKDSVVIDVGRAERTIKGPRRRALIARDRHCQWPGCDRPAVQCDGHHLTHWMFGGGGELENQVLLCQRHHWMVHEGGWQLVKTDEGRLMSIAPTITFGASARGPD